MGLKRSFKDRLKQFIRNSPRPVEEAYRRNMGIATG